MLRGATRIFRPEVYDKVFPPTPAQQAIRQAMKPEGEDISPDDFDSIDQFIKGLGNVKSGSIMGDDEGWV